MSSGLWYRTLVYLGLKEEPEEGYDDPPERVVGGDEPRVRGEVTHQRFDPVGDPDVDEPRRRSRDDDRGGAADDGRENVRPLRVADAASVRSHGGAVRLAVVDVGRFEDVEEVGSRYRTGQPVLFDVSGADGAAARRVVDFVAGLTYALRGRMAKVGTRAFLLVPDGVELPDDEARRLTALGYRLPPRRDDA
ncbi:cell division protein SepF [Nitriliruptor alkaliphilus]|uniref:cell division protein SepF n=1 Tax=Nitriliruptor alkaliphilus TaxID=427918 RepID=UPI0006963018|nr:cell division protein SepF [Nitriliruptor alkaliphilus]